MKTCAALAIVALAGLSATVIPGCVITGTVYERRPRPVYVARPAPVVIAPPGPVVVERPAPQPTVILPPPPQQVVIMRQPPPAPRVEVIRPRPNADVVWVPGYFAPQGGAWAWVPGRYERPPRRGAVWVAPRYEVRSANSVEFSLGFWR